MSHFSKLSVQVKNMVLAKKVAEGRGWTVKKVDRFDNPWRAAKEHVDNCHVFSANGQTKLVVDSAGNVIHDAFSMGRDVNSFLQGYSEAYIRKMAAEEGARVVNKGVDANGSIVLEIEYA